MKVLKNYEDLVGKTIFFVEDMSYYGGELIIATTDKEVLMTTFRLDENGKENEVRILDKHQVIKKILDSKRLQDKLDELGIFNAEEYRERLEEIKREHRLEEERKERKLLAKLKKKYENV
ncbi:hypothetical protein [Bacillus sp. ISL-7]|uniref:hypothetical protein n=1 Tax=Bacillus sp. ISL-7 TaxID=2819136 RepID=UPI001BE56A5D|nr:hypothetical protein [Bacillus sp. ISL-7]MBT2736222.1 hypothetical protein [Bacillus sp. ISL-7]